MKEKNIARSKGSTPTLGGVVGKPTLTTEETARVVDVMRRLKRERFNDNGAALARALGVSQPNVSDLLSGKHRPSFTTAKKVAKLAGLMVLELLGPESAGRPRRVTHESHPNLFAALRLVRERSPAGAREAVTTAAEHLPDLALGTWVSMITDPAHRTSGDLPTLESELAPQTGERMRIPKKPA